MLLESTRYGVKFGSGNGLVPSGNKPLTEPVMTQFIGHVNVYAPPDMNKLKNSHVSICTHLPQEILTLFVQFVS